MIIRLLTIIGFLCLSGAAHAQNAWSAPGHACIPAHSTIGSYRTNLASVQHLGSSTDPLVFICQIERFDSGTSDWNLRLTYRDSTGSDTAAVVFARVYRMAHGTTTAVNMATATSNSSPVTTINTVASPQFTHPFNFDTNTYWVRVELRRSAGNQSVIFYSVVLDGTSA